MTTNSQIMRESTLVALHPLAKWSLFAIGLALFGYVLWSVCFVLIRLLGLGVSQI